MRMLQKLRGLPRAEQGLSTVEYVVLLVLIVAMSVGTWKKFGKDVQGKLEDAQESFSKNVKASN